MSSIANPSVAEVFARYPARVRKPLLELRRLILQTARETPGVGAIHETLKWGEPAYLTNETKSGSTIRIHQKRGNDSKYSMYFNCNTTLVDSFRTLFPKSFRYHGNREIELSIDKPPSQRALKTCIAMALTYHLKKKQE